MLYMNMAARLLNLKGLKMDKL